MVKDRHGGGAKVILSKNPKNHTKAGPLIATLYRKEKLCAAWSQNRVNPGKLAGQGRRAPENAGRPDAAYKNPYEFFFRRDFCVLQIWFAGWVDAIFQECSLSIWIFINYIFCMAACYAKPID